jgi:23S rRNA (uracil1939-C5)-methyltransferase
MSEVYYKIHDLCWDGSGVARSPDGRVVMISGALPGDVVTARLTHTSSRNLASGFLQEIVTPSPDRVEHPCPHYARRCPASPLGALKYDAALAWKCRHLSETLRRIGKQVLQPVSPPLTADPQWGYRNRLELHCFSHRGVLRFGYRRGAELIPIENCLLAAGEIQDALRALYHAMASQKGWEKSALAADSRPDDLPRLLVHRNGLGGVVCVLFLRHPNAETVKRFQDLLQCAGLAGWQIRQVRDRKTRHYSSHIVAQESDVSVAFPVAGGENLVGSPLIFSQVNTAAARKMIVRVLDQLPEGGALLDLYGGYGAFALAYAWSQRGRARVVESSEEAVRVGAAYAKRRSLPVEYQLRDLQGTLPEDMNWKDWDAAVLDPPRSGMHDSLLQQVNRSGPRRLVYVSCHPAALARDLTRLPSYRACAFIPVDLFPQTPDLETIAILDRI